MIPKIEFVYSWFYDDLFRNSKDVKGLIKKINLKRKKELKYHDPKKVIKYKNEAKIVWKKYGKEILKSIQKGSGLKWRDKKIVVYVVGFHRHFLNL